MVDVRKMLVRGLATVFPNALFYKPTDARVIALTIDDIPTPNEAGDESTQLILDAIATHNQSFSDRPVRATFFVISSHLSEGTNIVDRILQNGHEIGNHGVIDTTHAYLEPAEFERQLRQAHHRLLSPQQPKIRWYRPGRGLYRPSMIKAIARLGEREGYEMKVALASVLPLDTFKFFNNPRFTNWYVSQFIFSGAVLVLHGGSRERSRNTARALEQLLPAIARRGYRVVTLSQLWDEG